MAQWAITASRVDGGESTPRISDAVTRVERARGDPWAPQRDTVPNTRDDGRRSSLRRLDRTSRRARRTAGRTRDWVWERHWDRESRGTRHTRSRRHRTEVRARGQSSESQRPERGARPLKPPTRRAPTRRRSGAVGAERVDVRPRACGDWCAVSTKKYSNRHLTHQTWIILRQCRCGVGRIVGWRDSTRDRSGGRGATRERLQDSPLIY